MQLEQDKLLEAAARLSPQWLAGFFDGEGCVSARITKGTTTQLRVSITQKDMVILGLIFIKFPGGSIQRPKHYLKNGKGFTHSHVVMWHGKHMLPILEAIKDYVIVKREQIELAIEFTNLVPDRSDNFKGLSEEGGKRRGEIVNRIRAINQIDPQYKDLDSLSDDELEGLK